MNREQAFNKLMFTMSAIISHLQGGWLHRMMHSDDIYRLQNRRMELLAIIANFDELSQTRGIE